ncbi:Nn.00g002880.m01.CDS01 [Neocucurbitaria sp. VM-36]
MASTNAAPPGQEQPKAHAVPDNLDMLQSMLNLIFLQSGRFIKEHQAGGGTGRMKLGMQRTVPAATERFHDALDELENEVRLAQTVLRRDLALLKQDRKKREAAAKQHEAEKARLAAESRNAPPKKVDAPIKTEKVSTPAQPEAPPAAEHPAPEQEPEKALKREEEPAPPPPIETALEPARDPLFDGTPTTANPQESEFDFEAIFGDAMDTSGDNNNNADDMMDTSGDMNFTLDEGGPTLLRGLEDFVDNDPNQSTSMDIDFPMPDLPDLHTNTNANANTNTNTTSEQATTATAATKPTDQPTTESTTQATTQPTADDAKNTTTDEDMMATMAADDLDDLFNMDEYENPENSSFDDAFFNFDN